MAESDWLLDLHVVSMVRGSLSTPSTSSSWVLSELSIKLIESISRLSRFVTALMQLNVSHLVILYHPRPLVSKGASPNYDLYA